MLHRYIRINSYATLLFAFCITSLMCGAQQKLLLTNNGKSDYTIIIPANATPIEQKAGKELQTYLGKISGVQLPIASDNTSAGKNEILVGKTNRVNGINYNNLGEDGLLIKTNGNKLIITGGKRKGVLYGVYTFLEEYLGCRKYARDVTYIPSISRIEIPSKINNQQLPAFNFRTTLFTDSSDPSYADWHKLNYFFEGWGSFAHTFEKLLPPEKYFKQHPEYYALVNGVRVPGEPCLSNPDVVKIITDNLRLEMAQKPSLKYWSVSQNDNSDCCYCNLCKPVYDQEKSQQGTIIRLVNKVADAFPDKVISTLAYQYSMRPPKITKPRKNVVVIFCTITAPKNKPINQLGSVDTYKQYLNDWSKLCDNNNLFIWDYVVQFPAAWLPYPNLNTLQPNLQYFQQLNAQYLFEQGIGADMDGEFSALRSYIISKLMWNPQIDFDKTLNDFLSGYYGKNAAADIKNYISAIQQEASRSNAPMMVHDRPQASTVSYLSSGNIKNYINMLEPALTKTQGTPYYNRVRKIALSLSFAQLEANKSALDNGNTRSNIEAKSIRSATGATRIANTVTPNKAQVSQELSQFIKDCNSLGVQYLNEGKQSIQTYNDNYKKLLGAQ